MALGRVVRKRGNIWIWAAVGMVAGPWTLGKVKQISGVGLSLPRVGGNGG